MGVYGRIYNFTQQKSVNEKTREATICMKYSDMCYLAENEKSFVNGLIEDNGWNETDLIVLSADLGYDSMIWMDGKLHNSDISVLDYLDLSESQQERILFFLKEERKAELGELDD